MAEKPDISQMFGGTDTSIRELGALWGERHHHRRTMGNPARSRMLAVFEAIGDACQLPELNDAAKLHGHLWAGEDGWETEMLVKAVSAAKAQMTLPAPEKKKVFA